MNADNQNSREIIYSTQKQVFETEGKMHKGKQVIAEIDGNKIGSTGYIEWNRDNWENNGLNTARMYKVDKPDFVIEVEMGYRENGVGTGLFKQLLQTVSENGFNQLLIKGVYFEVNGFYDTVLEGLEETNLLNEFTKTPRCPGGCMALPVYDYDILL